MIKNQKNFYIYLKQELLIQDKLAEMDKYTLLFITISCGNILANINNKLMLFSCSLILIFINLRFCANFLFKNDIEDGFLEIALSSFSNKEIVITKFLALCFFWIKNFLLILAIILLIKLFTGKFMLDFMIIYLVLISFLASISFFYYRKNIYN